MGAHTFQHTILGKGLQAQTAYNQLVAEALHQEGHDPYNGTISTTDGYMMVYVTHGKRHKKLINRILNGKGLPLHKDIRKWGPAGCIELKGAALSLVKKDTKHAGTRDRGYVFFGWAAS